MFEGDEPAAVCKPAFRGGGESQPGAGAAKLGVHGADAAIEGLGAGVRGPEGATVGEVLTLAAGHVVFVVHAVADDAALGGFGDGPNGGAVGAAVGLRQVEGPGDVWPSLPHLKLPVGPVVHARGPEHRGNFHPVPAGEVDKGLGGHARNNFQPNTGGIRRVLCDGARLAEVVPAGAGRHIHLHPLQRLNAQLGVVVDPLLRAVRSPHGLAVVSASVLLGGADSIGHAGAGGVQIPGEGAHKLKQVGITFRQVHGGGATHGQTEDGPVAIGPIAVLQHGDKLIEQEGLPHVVLAVVFGLPVGVEGGFAANRQDHIDVLVGEQLFNVGFTGPAAFNVGGPQPVEGPHLGEFPIRLGMPIAG